MTFDPKQHLMRLPKGGEYLEVKYRMVWFREENPNGSIVSEMVEHVAGEYAVFRATVTSEKGAVAIDYGSETKLDFKDYLEKASTKAVGRALASCGYGTAFAPEFDTGISEATGEYRIADAPINRNGSGTVPQPERPASTPVTRYVAPQRTEPANTTPSTSGAPRPNTGPKASDKSRGLAFMVATKESGIPKDTLYAWAQAMHGVSFDDLSQGNISSLIDYVREKKALPPLPGESAPAANDGRVKAAVEKFLGDASQPNWDAMCAVIGSDVDAWVEAIGYADNNEFLVSIQYQTSDLGLYEDAANDRKLSQAIDARAKVLNKSA